MASYSALPLFIIINIVFPVAVTAQQSSNPNITLRSFIEANADDATPTIWTSPSGQFAFGFHQVAIAPEAFLLAIWFDQLPQKTLVWSANRDNPVPTGSRVQLSADGTLELLNQTGQQIWFRTARSAAYAAMLDTGNFVLATNTSAVLWQSFDEPTDTLLPSQELKQGLFLVSSFSATNYSKGRFKLTMQSDGNLVLVTRSFPLDDQIDEYWSSETPEIGLRFIFNRSGTINFINENGSVHKPLFNNGALVAGQFQHRLTLEYDGVLRHYVYPISPNSSSTSTASEWSARDFVPPNICLSIRDTHTSGGACGFNGICKMEEANGRPSCGCPLGYSRRGGLSGCAPDFAQHRCDQQSQDAQNFGFHTMYNTDWPDVDYVNFRDVDEEWCRQSCLGDCYCAVVIYYNRYCYKKALPFSNGRVEPNIQRKALIKVRINGTFPIDPNTPASGGILKSSSSTSTLTIILSILLAFSVLLFLVSSGFFVFYFKHTQSMMLLRSRVRPAGVNTITSFSFKELQEATNEFTVELGSGACSVVYKGVLDENENGKVVAVKKLQKMAKEAHLEFIAEVSSISRTNHKNLVQLLGYCDEGQNRILVYEFMTNGSLATFLFDKSPKPNWYTRVQIAFATARGLCYLHEECSVPIIHCDIKPQNVLLDESYTPKIADFGLAKLLKPDQTRTNTGIRGTRGYVAPEWFRNMPITVKVDVYSFGILLLEILCCRKNYQVDLEDEREVVLADWAYDCYQEGALDLLVRGDEEAKSEMKMFERMVMTAIWCIQEDPILRPHMKRVMHMLEGSIQVPAVPDPTTFIS